MTDQQLYLAIGVPVILNIGTLLLGVTLMSISLNKRIDDLRSEVNTLRGDMNSRFDLTGRLLTEQFRRVEDLMDALVKHLRVR